MDSPIAGNACEVVDSDAREALQGIRDSCVSLRIEQEIDPEIRHMECSACVWCGLDDRSKWAARTEGGTCEFLRAAGGLMDGGFSARGIEFDTMVARVEFKLGLLARAVSADRDGHIGGLVLAGAKVAVIFAVVIDLISGGLEQVWGHAAKAVHLIDTASCAFVVKKQEGRLCGEGIDALEVGLDFEFHGGFLTFVGFKHRG